MAFPVQVLGSGRISFQALDSDQQTFSNLCLVLKALEEI